MCKLAVDPEPVDSLEDGLDSEVFQPWLHTHLVS